MPSPVKSSGTVTSGTPAAWSTDIVSFGPAPAIDRISDGAETEHALRRQLTHVADVFFSVSACCGILAGRVDGDDRFSRPSA